MNGQTINYENLAKEALRSVVKSVLQSVTKDGLPGDHHFYISFHTTAPGVKISNRISAQYPKEMTIVLQHQFWDLKVEEDHFEVRLSFANIPELLVIPYSAIKVFFDPSVPYGLQFDQTARPEAVEDKSAFMDEDWNIGAENSDLTIEELNEINRSAPNDPLSNSPINPLEAEEQISQFDLDTAERAATEESTETAERESGQEEGETANPSNADDGAEIVSLDAFRKKNS
jgi:hypothetical protein